MPGPDLPGGARPLVLVAPLRPRRSRTTLPDQAGGPAQRPPLLSPLDGRWSGRAACLELPVPVDRPAKHLLSLRGVDQVHVLVGVRAQGEDGESMVLGSVPRRLG